MGNAKPLLERFNTQPPEGGWLRGFLFLTFQASFNTQPPEGGWVTLHCESGRGFVSTHSRPKAAGFRHGEVIVFG